MLFVERPTYPTNKDQQVAFPLVGLTRHNPNPQMLLVAGPELAIRSVRREACLRKISCARRRITASTEQATVDDRVRHTLKS